MLEFLLNKVAGMKSSALLKRAQSQVFYCEFCEIFKNNYSVESMQTATSGLINSCETSKWLSYNEIWSVNIEYNKINIFLQKSCRKWSRETS